MRTTNLDNAKSIINSAFGSLVLTHRDAFDNAVTDGHPSGGGWYDSTVELMNEIMVYGCNVFAVANNGSSVPYRYTCCKKQLAIFQLNPRFIDNRHNIWLRDVVSSAYFAVVDIGGVASYGSATYSYGVLPYFVIG